MEVISRRFFDSLAVFFFIGCVSIYLLSNINEITISNVKLVSENYLVVLSFYLSTWFFLVGRSLHFSIFGFLLVFVFDRFYHIYFFGFRYQQLMPGIVVLIVYYFLPKPNLTPTETRLEAPDTHF